MVSRQTAKIGAKEKEYIKWCFEMTYEWDTDDFIRGWETSPIGSMYGIFTNIWLKSMVNVGKYTIHGSYGSTGVIEMSENRKKFATLLGNHRLVMFIISAPMEASAESAGNRF